MSTITREFTKEQLIEWAQKHKKRAEEYLVAVPNDEYGLKDLALAEIALASLEAEAVAYADLQAFRNFQAGVARREWMWANPDAGLIPLHTAPPAPVSVPDEDLLNMAASAIEDLLSNKDRPGAGVWADIPVKLRRAAMLQGAEPVTMANKLPFEQWISQQTGTIDVECGCVMTEVFFHWLRVAYEAGNSPHCRESAETSTKCWCHTCRPVTISDMRFVVCPECGNKRCPHANDHRNACTGSNEPGQEGGAYPAAPQQEVKP
ncbi:hypothetical protein [Enterobacter cloacae complex sp. 277I4]|uniref:hypothetical protein n=1 Tax=Enterobacter cloacae complex sp. 277I4 TaxID=3395873 RepID=UPI0027EB1C75|nr:hypothetical protein [Enterobacter cloacae]HDT6027734.1 hypothetical protein [Enterobacter cloacae subsp. cloacae]HDT6093803.1 hypothetical protein [Enterobacter cloacae subsp. cloacae]